MNLEEVKDHIKEEEGYRDTMYKDHLGFATIGYGHLVLPRDKFKEGVKYSQKELEKVFEYDFQIAYQDAVSLCKDLDVSYECVEIIIHMCFQLGKPKVSKFSYSILGSFNMGLLLSLPKFCFRGVLIVLERWKGAKFLLNF